MPTLNSHLTRTLSPTPNGSRLGSVVRSAIRQIMWGSEISSTTTSRESRAITPKSLATAKCAVLVLDASPSMEDSDWPPSRLRAAQEAACAYVQQVAEDDPNAHIAVVAYHKCAKVQLRLTPACDGRRLAAAINRITTANATNITAGLEAAARLLRGRPGPNQILLLTDGDHNWGPSPIDIVDRVHGLATVECVGIGGSPDDVNERLLRSIASSFPNGSKRYRWIGDKARLVEHFRQVAGRLTRS